MTNVPGGNFAAVMACAENRPNAMPTWIALPTASVVAGSASTPAKAPTIVIMAPSVVPMGAASRTTQTHALMQPIVSSGRSAGMAVALRAVMPIIRVLLGKPVMKAVYAKTTLTFA